jgi:hypothetical protein
MQIEPVRRRAFASFGAPCYFLLLFTYFSFVSCCRPYPQVPIPQVSQVFNRSIAHNPCRTVWHLTCPLPFSPSPPPRASRPLSGTRHRLGSPVLRLSSHSNYSRTRRRARVHPLHPHQPCHPLDTPFSKCEQLIKRARCFSVRDEHLWICQAQGQHQLVLTPPQRSTTPRHAHVAHGHKGFYPTPCTQMWHFERMQGKRGGEGPCCLPGLSTRQRRGFLYHKYRLRLLVYFEIKRCLS